MQAVILAAGLGSRLHKLTGGKSKALVEIGDRPLILHQLESLADHGVGPILVVVGHSGDELQQVIGDRAETLLNDRFTETNSLYSLWLARDWIKGPFLLLNCDLFFDPVILDRLLDESGNVLVYDSTSSRGREQTKVAVKKRRVVDLGKDLPPASARGENLGMLMFDEAGSRTMLKTADELIRSGHEDAWVIEATRAVCSQVPVYGLNVAGQAWTEIDFPYDLDVARREVWPLIWKGRWRKAVYWKRSRWAAIGVAALTLALAGWLANSYVGEASVNWETVPASGGDAVSLVRGGGKTQRWWTATADTVIAIASESSVLVETRLAMPAGAPARKLHYVVSITVDGRAHDWKLYTAALDSTVRLEGRLVGDKDRMALSLPEGIHKVGVSLVSAQGGELLVRIRQAETREP